MKLLKTNYTNLPMQNLAKLEFSDSLKITQLDETGMYIQTLEKNYGVSGTYIVDKKELSLTLDTLKDDFDIEAKKSHLLFSKDETKIKVKLIVDLPFDIKLTEYGTFKPIPENFINRFNEAAKFAFGDKGRLILDSVLARNGNIISTNRYIIFISKLDGIDGIDLALPKSSFSVIKNPKEYQVVDEKLIIKSDDAIGYISLHDGEYPDVAKAFELQTKDEVEITQDTKELKDIVDTIIKLGHKEIILDNKEIYSKDETFNIKTNLEFANKYILDVNLLSKILIDGTIFAADKAIYISNETTKIMLVKKIK